MWMAEPINIEVARNTTTPLGFQFWDQVADAPLDISDYSFICRISINDGQNAIANHVVDVSDAASGEYNIVFDGRMYDVTGAKERVILSYQVIADDGEAPVTAQRGSIFLVSGVN